jgi:hypothetical protein
MFIIDAWHTTSDIHSFIGPYATRNEAWERIALLTSDPKYGAYQYSVQNLHHDTIFKTQTLCGV